ncbi:hypothetical protein [Gracilibacillus kekensis]|uniref:Lipoprotein n=1 Tax=Gracilibacillus kekensis TaxID=1027249 RepID=A0A1M7LCI2_9BACI|nr:hypothetical protein [Gracilibacillus kekensis]SHM75816.1 hypothetical protein SAMN05216179_1032 [Gracilibacillus kekensis]
MKKMTLILILLFASILTTACANKAEDKTTVANDKEVFYTGGYFNLHEDVESLENLANLVVKGKVLGTTVEWRDPAIEPDETDDEYSNPGGEIDHTKLIFTVHKVKVDHSYKGDIEKGDIIEVKQIGGEIGNTIMIDEDVSYLEKDKEYILFLETLDDSPANLLNPFQGSYEYENGKIISNPNNTITIKLETLEKLE